MLTGGGVQKSGITENLGVGADPPTSARRAQTRSWVACEIRGSSGSIDISSGTESREISTKLSKQEANAKATVVGGGKLDLHCGSRQLARASRRKPR